MYKNKCTLDVFILFFKRVRAVDQDTRLLSRGFYPFSAIWCRGSAWCRQDGGCGKQKSEEHGEVGYHMEAVRAGHFVRARLRANGSQLL